MHALDAATGEALWTHRMRARIDSSPVIFGERVVFGASSGEITMIDVTSGAVVWEFQTGSSIIASPAIAEGRLVIGTEDGQMYAFGPGGTS
jgi:outer membrane protein assembly factor BamB